MPSYSAGTFGVNVASLVCGARFQFLNVTSVSGWPVRCLPTVLNRVGSGSPLHGQPELPLHTHVAKREVMAGRVAHVLRARVTTRRRVGQQRFGRVAVEEIGQWQRHVVSLGKRVERAVDGLWHRCLREHLLLLDGHRQLLAVVPGLEPLAAGQRRVKTIGTP